MFNNLWAAVASINWSIQGSGKLYLGQALIKSVKSMHISHFPLAFLTITKLETHSRYFSSRMKLFWRSFNFSVNSIITLLVECMMFLLGWEKVGSTLSLWISRALIPDIPSWDYVKHLYHPYSRLIWHLGFISFPFLFYNIYRI